MLVYDYNLQDIPGVKANLVVTIEKTIVTRMFKLYSNFK